MPQCRLVDPTSPASSDSTAPPDQQPFSSHIDDRELDGGWALNNVFLPNTRYQELSTFHYPEPNSISASPESLPTLQDPDIGFWLLLGTISTLHYWQRSELVASWQRLRPPPQCTPRLRWARRNGLEVGLSRTSPSRPWSQN
jgi:hypothetical protein